MARAAFRGLSEAQEGADLADWLDARHVLYVHVPNGGLRSGREAASLRRQGVKPGCPDYLIFSEPSQPCGRLACGGVHGVALELKKASGGVLSAVQDVFIPKLHACSWVVLVAHGANDAIAQLEALGY